MRSRGDTDTEGPRAHRPPAPGTPGRLAQLSIESVNVDSPLLIYWALREKESQMPCVPIPLQGSEG